MMLNVTDRKLAEEQLKINSNALQHLTEGVVITDPDLRIVTVNKAFATLMGYNVEKTLGRHLSEFLVRDQPELAIENIRTAVIHDGGWKGELRSRRANGELFPALFSFSAVRDGSGEIEYFTGVFTDLSTFREFERRIEYLSHSDVLTGLPNRTSLATHMKNAEATLRADGGSVALLVAELDSFKTVNDTVGHATGDLLLQSVAERLQRLTRSGDLLARLGGDEFGILAFNRNDTNEVHQFAESLRTAIERPFRIAGQDVFITASIGVSSFPSDGQNFDALLRAADAAVYRAKQLGRNSVSRYSPEMNAATTERFTLQNGLAHALSRQELVVEYQPTIDLYTGRLTGAEALLRWRHPKLGLVLPTRFIGLAEDTGLIVPIGDWVLRTACRQVNKWVAAGWDDATVAVNLSPRQFNQPDLQARIADALASANIEPWRLRMEVTESMVMSDPDRAAVTLQRLSQMGIQFALDDFGTGYSSLNYLKRFRLGCIKVDRSFVSGVASDIEDASIVRAIIALGKALGMKIIAEGIETVAQAEFLRNAGCDDGQGFYYSPATSPEDVRAMAMNPFPLAAGSLQSQLDLTIGNA
jgi:diguanylate cyclase (GGDEF)-like protein/PAS domain S-box-containing protein